MVESMRSASGSSGTVVVLGGNGFVGSHVVRSFAQRGFRVRSASRSAAPPRLGPNIESVRCDVRDASSTAEALRGADVVVASFVGDRRTQVDGTANVLAALQAGGPPLLYLSTAEVYGAAVGRLDETAPLLSQGWEYSDSKIEAEALCQQAAQRGVKVTLFRPSIVYGPGAETWVVELGNNLVRGHWGTLGSFGKGTCNLLYVDDLVEALHLALGAQLPPGTALNLNGPDQITWNELFSLLNEALGLPKLRDWSRAEALLRACFGQLPRAVNALLSRLRGARASGPRKAAHVVPEGERLSLLQGWLAAAKATPRLQPLTQLYPREVVYVDDKARRLLDYAARVPAREGIARSAAWYLAARAGEPSAARSASASA
jgi:nucleoside-diphosphate-sugar epimerase